MKNIQKTKNLKSYPQLISNYLIITILLLLAYTLTAQEWTEPVNVSNLEGYNMNPDMIIDNNGVIHVVWSYKIEDNYWKVMYAYSEDDGHSWSEALDLVQNTDLWLSKPHIAYNSKNNLHVTYDYNTGTPNKMIYIMVFDGNQWSEPILVSEGMPGSHYNYVIIDYNDRVYVFWDYSNTGDNYYRYFENNTWTEPYCPYPGNDEIYALVEAIINSDNSIHWVGSSLSANYFGERLQYFFYDYNINKWKEPIMPVYDTIKVGKDIYLNNNGNPEIAYREQTNVWPNPFHDATMYIKNNGNFWVIPELIVEDPKGQQIAIDKYDSTHIIDREKTVTGQQLVHYQKYNNEWNGYIIDSSGNMVNGAKLLYYGNKLYLTYFKSEVPGDMDSDILLTKYDIVTGIVKREIIKHFKIYPNPFRFETTIEFSITNKKNNIRLQLFDLRGNLIKTIINENKSSVEYRIIWNGKGKNGKEVNSGLYLIRLQSGRNIVTRSVGFIK